MVNPMTTPKVKPKDKPHYVNNAQFSQAVVDHCTKTQQAKADGMPVPVIPDYIATCFLKICEGLSHKANFVRYTYREEMVMDAVENCLKAIENYNIEAATRTGKPNAFAYFTQISWFAFLRRIEKEKKQQEIKTKYMGQMGIDVLLDNDLADDTSMQVAQAYVDTLRMRIDEVKSKDAEWKEIVKKERKRRTVKVDSDLGDFISE
jgi:FtsZ-binding cell division protein ZapB|tara:strand:- start:1382 stop:1996 length:615 start_codon:yes stop_codon:yes gene_type:complete